LSNLGDTAFLEAMREGSRCYDAQRLAAGEA
jgi:hypothetical protein